MPLDPIARLLAVPPDLPVLAGLPRLRDAVQGRGVAVLQAPPGTGKTTLVPPALALAVEGRVIVTQPRRVAARAAAVRLAHLLDEPVGRTAGYTVRGEQRTSSATRVELVTTGVLLRRLQRDPELPGVGAVVLDEVHERHLDGDLALALLVDVRANLRDELAVVAMSATVEAHRTARLLGGEDADSGAAPVVEVGGGLFPVARFWCPPPPRVARTDERGVTRGFLDHVAATVRRALSEQPGDVLVFLPGAAEVDIVGRRLADVDADVRPLHGRLPHAQQDRALVAGPRRRVVVSTALAESSLTVPGVRVVVDAGFSREPRADHRRGLAGLVTVAVSRSSAEQRAGRAGREGPGAVYRCWSPADDARLREHPEPEIRTADLTAFALELACWGSPDGADLALLDPAPAPAMAAARATLRGLGAVAEDGSVTPRGRAIAAIPADPRLARALLDGAADVGSRRACEIVALLADDVRIEGGDLVAALRAVRRDPHARRWTREVARLHATLAEVGGAGSRPAHPGRPSSPDRPPRSDRPPPPHRPDEGRSTDDHAVGLLVALAHPDRIARRRGEGASYLMTSGTGAVLPPGSPLTGAPWLAIADVDRAPGRADATVRSAVPIDEDTAREAGVAMCRTADRVEWRDGRVEARRESWLGAVLLTSAPIPDPPRRAVAAAVRAGLERDGPGALRWTPAAADLRRRMQFLHLALGSPWPDVSDHALAADLDAWLGPQLDGVRRAGDLARIDVLAALRALLPWPQAARLDELAPQRITVPSGRDVPVDYAEQQPVLALHVQEAFGWRAAPRLADGRVPVLLHLLSPAGRPAAVTADLESFWTSGYPQVRAELRGRYPKHSWPEDPLGAEPQRGPKRRPREQGPRQ